MYFLPDQWFEFLAAKGIFWIFRAFADGFFAFCIGTN
jgi:hypothetical protein